MELFESTVIRSLGLYQPFASLMGKGKVETRWVRKNKRPPFPLGKYLIYSTLKECSTYDLAEWCGANILSTINQALFNDPTKHKKGFALFLGELVQLEPMKPWQEGQCFVKHKGIEFRHLGGVNVAYVQWCLYFKNIKPLNPFPFKGKQGVGVLTEEQKKLIHANLI